MEQFPWLELPEEGLPLYASIAVTFLLALVLLLWFSRDPEAAVKYTVSPPPQIHPDWKGEILDTPSIKVSGSQAKTMALMDHLDLQVFCYPVLLSSYRTASRPRKPFDP
jgi:hypothetical protein